MEDDSHVVRCSSSTLIAIEQALAAPNSQKVFAMEGEDPLEHADPKTHYRSGEESK